MRAAILTAPNTPLKLDTLPDPKPGPGQIRLRMRASGLCGTDMHAIHGRLPVKLPIVLGHEPVGVVDEVGAGVANLRAGDRVGVSWVQSGCGRCAQCQRLHQERCRDSRSWTTNGGGNADYMIADAWGATILPDAIGWEEAAPIFCAGFTAMSGYRNARPRPGERVAVIGIGGLGHLAVQIAKAMGHEVVAITSTENKRAEAKALGADDVLVVKEHAGKELMAMGGADVVLSTSNSNEQSSQVVLGLRPGGRLVLMAFDAKALTLDPTYTLMAQVTVTGSLQSAREDLVDLLELVAKKKVMPKLEVYPLADVNKAVERLDTGKVRYRAVMTIGA
jgi:D-arabinose 1-dehydrogenase-like Zn-dependent alcohol dehydrogenase